MRTFFVLLALCAAMMIGCGEDRESSRRGFVESLMMDLVYMKDYRVNLCFASTGAIDSRTLVAVPCTPAVEALIINKREEQKGCNNNCKKNYQPERMDQK